ncbi:MAG: ribonucleotide reductase N-terminal alpha domain-containing protein [archaeon]
MKPKVDQEEVDKIKKELMKKKVNVTDNARTVLQRRYLLKDQKGKVCEAEEELFARVATNISLADRFYDEKADLKKTAKEFYEMMSDLDFMPNSPTLMNAGRELQQLSACFVLPLDDDMNSIMQSLYDAVMVHKSGGGTGFSFSRLRPNGSIIKSTNGTSPGPVSFIRMYNNTTEEIKQGGTRRGANMGILRIDHPDIISFIYAKEDNNAITNFNLSIAVTDKFMQAVNKGQYYNLVNPHTKMHFTLEQLDMIQSQTHKDASALMLDNDYKKVLDRHTGEELGLIRDGAVLLNARKVFDLIVKRSWKNGEPGIIFIDKMNDFNPTPAVGEIESTNPCVVGETLIPTTKGMMPIKELAADYHGVDVATDARALAYSSDGRLLLEQKGVSNQRISKVMMTGTKPVSKLITKSGYELLATDDHRILTTQGWKELGKLTIQDEVLIQSGSGCFNPDDGLGFKSKYAAKWSQELGQVLGWLVGDGWLREGNDARVGFTFSQGDIGVFEHLKPFINQLYGREIKEVLRENKVIHLSYHSIGLVDFFKKLGAKPVRADKKEVPASLFRAPESAVKGFLQGLFTADGTISTDNPNNTNYIRLSSKSRELLKGTQLLLLNMGIKATIYERHRNRRISFQYKTVRGELRLYESDGILYELQVSKSMIPLFMDRIGFLCGKHETKLAHLRKIGFYNTRFEDRVISIEPQGLREVYDLTEPVTHSFIANGIIVHNCGEQPLLPYESCNLGSINVANFIKDEEIDYDRLSDVIHSAVHFLDNVIDMNNYPLKQIEQMSISNRKIGLGLMGFADLLIKLGIPYSSDKGVKTAEKLMKFIDEESKQASIALAKTRGVFLNFKDSIFDKHSKNFKGKELQLRNATTTTIAPTGTISIIANASGGIEPLFAIAFKRSNILHKGDELIEVNPLFEQKAKDMGFYSKELMKKVCEQGTIAEIEEIPREVRRVFVTSHDISPEYHIRMQAAFQKYTDNAVSKTVNFKHDATEEDVRKVFEMAFELGCKGATVYRDGSRDEQVLNIMKDKKPEAAAAGAADAIQRALVKKKRPMVTFGATRKTLTGCGNFYITINQDESGELFEVFNQMGKAGGCADSQAEAIGRLVSLGLRSGINPKEIIMELKGISCHRPAGFGPNRVLSCADAVGRALEQHMNEIGIKLAPPAQQSALSNYTDPGKMDLPSDHGVQLTGACPICGGPLTHVEGCVKCAANCGYSECS